MSKKLGNAQNNQDRPEYLARKKKFDHMITIYGRNPVLEVLRDPSLQIYRLHLAKSNRDSSTVRELKDLAAKRDIEVALHSREQLSRISRNNKQDQGVACDIYCPGFQPYQEALKDLKNLSTADNLCIIALDSVTNPQNLGMIIRSVTASPAYGLLLPSKGSAAISPLVIKASAGTAFKGNILSCDDLEDSLKEFQKRGFKLCTLTSHNATPIKDFSAKDPIVFILGNETHGVRQSIMDISDYRISIPMKNGVESLNVAVTAALIAFNL
ncbi:MAG: putative tRNA/rRNA methyltransferase [Cellvibrionales bacterium UBA7375]|nr:MAG: putative tRNA/rRNA methyltransferase [Cellvibrionales bacterium UBA7375]